MKDYAENFRKYLSENKKASDNTIESYMRDILQFSSYCTSVNLNDTASADRKFLEKYTEKLRSIGKSEATGIRCNSAVNQRCRNTIKCVHFLPPE